MRVFIALLVILFFVLPVGAERAKLSESERVAVVNAVNVTCPLVLEEAALVQAIQEEQANPTGVVNLRTLYVLGQSLQSTRYQLSQTGRKHKRGLGIFRRWAGKPLDFGFCYAHEAQREAEEDVRNAEAAALRN